MELSAIILAGGKSKRFGFNKIKLRIGDTPLFVFQAAKLGFFCNDIIISTSEENYPLIKKVLDEFLLSSKRISIGIPGKECKAIYGGVAYEENINSLSRIKIVLDDEKYNGLTGTSSGSIGPLQGIYSGLLNSSHFYSIVAAFDMPFLSYNLLKLLSDSAKKYASDAIIIKTKKGIEPLCGIYSKNCIKVMEDNISRGHYKISEIFGELDVSWIYGKALTRHKIDMYNFFNINSLEDYHKFNDLLKSEVLFKNNTHNTHNIRNGKNKKWENYFYRGD